MEEDDECPGGPSQDLDSSNDDNMDGAMFEWSAIPLSELSKAGFQRNKIPMPDL